jgi:hypothetical protein
MQESMPESGSAQPPHSGQFIRYSLLFVSRGFLPTRKLFSFLRSSLHCNENSIDVFPEKELCGLSPSFHLHASVSELYIHPYFPAAEYANRSWEYINRSMSSCWRPKRMVEGLDWDILSVLNPDTS